MTTRTVTMRLVRETKGAALYQEVEDGIAHGPDKKMGDCLVGTQYLRKSAYPNGVPKKYTLTITPID